MSLTESGMMIRRGCLILTMVMSVVLMVTSVYGQEMKERPRIGLCLAGGGARGGAHVGVLKVLEELHIPVDFIAGTSIGSIVGGLYASGMSPAEMDSALSAIDWFDLFDDAPPRKLTNFRRKEEDRRPYLPFEMGIGKKGLKTPVGVVAGPKLIFLLRKLTLPVVGIEDFDDLPIPFRAVASNLNTSEMAVLDHGPLADAMRASMAIPGAFTPHVIDGQTLVDGGMIRNLPYDVVKSMGADIIIVVDVGPTPDPDDNDLTLAGVLGQTAFMTIAANSIESLKQLGDEDVLLVPDLEGISVESFEKMGEAVDRGLAVADQNLEQLRRLAIPEEEYEAWRTRVQGAAATDEIQIAKVLVDSPGRVDPRRVEMRIQSEPGSSLDLEVLKEDLSRVGRLGEFEVVDYSLEPSDDPPARDLVIHTQDKRWGPNYLRFGLAMEGHLDGQSTFILYLYHRLASINRLGAEWRNQVTVGDLLSLDTEFYQPLTINGRFFVAPRLLAGVDKRQRWLEGDLSEIVRSRQYQGRLDLGLNMSHWGELRLGAYHGYYSGQGDNNSLDLDESLGGWRGRLAFDQQDDPYFPKRGWALIFDGRLARQGLGADTEYDRLAGQAEVAATSGRTTFSGKIAAGSSFGTELPFNDRFELGGFSRLSGVAVGRLFGDDMALMTAGFYVQVLTLNQSLGGNIYVGLAGETGQTWSYDDKPCLHDLEYGGTLYLGVESLLGPLYLGYGLTEGYPDSFYVIIGRSF